MSNPSLPKIADFLLYLHESRNLAPISIKGYRSMLSLVFRSKLPEISSSLVLKDLLRSFEVQRPPHVVRAPSWDLNKVLKSLRVKPFEPLGSVDLKTLTKKVLFLVALATAKRVGELQAISFNVAKEGSDLVLSYLPEFLAKTESASNQLPRSFPLKSLGDFVGELQEELLLCPVRALSIYLKRTRFIESRPRSLFVSPKNPKRPMSKNGISFFLRQVISDAGAVGPDEGPGPRAHSIRAVSTSVAFAKNWSIAKVLEAATWSSGSVFSSFYLRDVARTLGDLSSLGPIVSAGQVVVP